MELTSENVTRILKDCLFKEGEETTEYKQGQGYFLNIGFHPERLEDYRVDIEDMINQLPDQFHEKTGGGWSFLNACQTKDGKQWGEHRSIDELLCLGLALGKLVYLTERKLWSSFPGGMPYFMIKE
jgi:hypothetical protein